MSGGHMSRNRILILLAFICTSFIATSVAAQPAEMYERVLQVQDWSNAKRLQKIIEELGINFVFPENGGVLNFQCAASFASELSPKAFLLVFKESLVSVLSRLQKEKGSVGVDSLLFAQIAAMLLDGKGNEVGFQLAKGTASYLDLTLLSERKFLHIVPEHVEAKKFLLSRKLPYRSGEIWLLDVGDETWVGMTRSGPQILKLSEWQNRMKHNIELEYLERLSSGDALSAMALEVLIKTGRLERWTTDL